MSRIILVDGQGLIHRSYHANKKGGARDAHVEGDGMGAVTQFRKTLDRIMARMAAEPGYTHFGTIFDASRSKARMAMFPGYKGNRPPLPDEFLAQIPMMKRAAAEFGPTVEMDGYEADDILATYAQLAEAEGIEVVVATIDKDLAQIVRPGVSLFDPFKKIYDGVPCHVEEYDREGHLTQAWSEKGKVIAIGGMVGEDEVVERWGVSPSLVPDILAIVGDSSDNIAGLSGIGEVGAKKLIAAFGDLEAVLAQGGNAKLTQKQRDAITYGADQARLAKALINLDCEVPVPEPVSYFEAL